MDKAISVIIPTYNESDNVTPLVERLHSVLSSYNYEIVFVDDDSSDGTAERARALSGKYPIKLIVRKDEKGLASAVVRGIKQSSGKTILVMDADLQHPPEVIPDLLKATENGADIAIASRYIAGGSCQGWTLTRRIISKGGVFLARLLLPSLRKISDPMSGFFVLKRDVVANANLNPTGFKILLEVLIKGQFSRVAEVPYTFKLRQGGKSKLNTRQQIEYLKHLYSLMRQKGELLRFGKFCLVGFSGVFVNMGLLWILTEFAGLFYLLSSAISIEVSIISNFTLNDYFTFTDRRLPGAKSFGRRLLKFNIVSLAGLGINMGILALLTEGLGLYYLLSNIIGIIVATLWNYFVNSWWTWNR